MYTHGPHVEEEVKALYRDSSLTKPKALLKATKVLRTDGPCPMFYKLAEKCRAETMKQKSTRTRRAVVVEEPD